MALDSRPNASVIGLQDLDKSLFSSLPSVNELNNLKAVLSAARNVLWITFGRLMYDPYANIMVGIRRALRHEHIHLNLQFLDFDRADAWNIQSLMTQFLRLVSSASSPSTTKELFWVQEPEIDIRNSQLVPPRVLLDFVSNEIFNSSRCHVIKPVNLVGIDGCM